jgi:hypothetical protein
MYKPEEGLQISDVDDAYSGWSLTVTHAKIKKHQHIWDNQRISINETASEISICS